MSIDMKEIFDAYREAWEGIKNKHKLVAGAWSSADREPLVGYKDESTGVFITPDNVNLYLEMVMGWRDEE